MIENFNAKDVILMKLLHYFTVKQNYKPIILQGVEDEIWLENLHNDYKVIRLVSKYIHNDEQMEFDKFKTKKILGRIKRKTFNFTMPVLSIYLDLGENVTLEDEKNSYSTYIKEEEDIKKSEILINNFPDILKNLELKEEGIDLFIKISNDINNKNAKEQQRLEDLFQKRVPVVTYILIALNILIYLVDVIFPSYSLINRFSTFGPLIRLGEYYRIVTGAFFHVDVFHLIINMYSLYVIGSAIEGFFGKVKYLSIYLFSLITASLLSTILNINTASVGASGAIFGLTGAMLYFGYHYRVYFGNSMINQILPIVILNLLFGFMTPGIDNFAHIGGLLGGLLISISLGLRTKEGVSNRLNGIILSILYMAFLIFMNFFVIK